MQNIRKIVFTILLIPLINCNFWDNIFSQTGASSPILLSQSLNFKFPLTYQGIDFDCYVDYNHRFKLLTVKGVKNVILFEVEAFRLQIDLQQFLVSFKNTLTGCKKYKLILTEQDSSKIQKISLSQKRFLVNILFKYIGRGQKDKNMNQYVFMPDLVTQHLQQHQQYQKNVLLVVDKGGNIVKVYTGVDKKQQIPIVPNSIIKDRLNCPGQVEQLTKQDLYEMIKDSIQNKDYENIPGFDKLPIDKIPFDKIPFDKLPKPSN